MASPMVVTFGSYPNSRVPAHKVIGPARDRFVIDAPDDVRPSELWVQLPEILINGQPATAPPFEMELKRRVSLVALCQ